MAYIDPDGMFGGERMSFLSDSAKLAWPWFWCASNTVGRVELNYREFSKTVFRQFKKPPTDTQFWEWVSEFHEAYLMFVYEVDGQAWGQWFVSEKYLPTYKTINDKRTPAPLAIEFVGWQKKYAELKVSLISGKCRVLSVYKNSPKVDESSPKFSLGVERRGEERNGEEGNGKDLCPAIAEPETLFPVEDRRGSAWFDASFARWYQAFWNKTKKTDARKAYEKRVKALVGAGGTHEGAEGFLITQAIEDRKRFEHTEDWDWRSRLLPTTWLNGERWEDQMTRARASPKGKDFVADVSQLMQARLERGEKPW